MRSNDHYIKHHWPSLLRSVSLIGNGVGLIFEIKGVALLFTFSAILAAQAAAPIGEAMNMQNQCKDLLKENRQLRREIRALLREPLNFGNLNPYVAQVHQPIGSVLRNQEENKPLTKVGILLLAISAGFSTAFIATLLQNNSMTLPGIFLVISVVIYTIGDFILVAQTANKLKALESENKKLCSSEARLGGISAVSAIRDINRAMEANRKRTAERVSGLVYELEQAKRNKKEKAIKRKEQQLSSLQARMSAQLGKIQNVSEELRGSKKREINATYDANKELIEVACQRAVKKIDGEQFPEADRIKYKIKIIKKESNGYINYLTSRRNDPYLTSRNVVFNFNTIARVARIAGTDEKKAGRSSANRNERSLSFPLVPSS